MMAHQGYFGRVEFDDEAGVFHGEVVGIRDVVTFQGRSVKELRQAFRASIDDYLAFCAERGEAPDEPCQGQFVAQLGPELHRQVSLAAAAAGHSVNAWVVEQLKSSLRPAAPTTRAKPKSAAPRTRRPAR